MIKRTETLRRALPWIAFVGSLLWTFGESLLAHMQRAADPLLLNDDARQQIYPFYRYADSALFPHDYIGDYYLACLPWGYRGLYTLAGYFDVAAEISKVVPYVGLLITVTCLAATAHAFGGKTGAWVAAALCLGSSMYLARMSGGLPRSFAFPLLAAASAALTYGRFRIAAALVPLGAAFYPAAAVPIGIALALTLLALPDNSRGDAAQWTLKRRFAFVAATAAIAALVLLPAALSSRGFGSVIRPDDIDRFPEAGPGGRYGRGDRAPFAPFFEVAQPTATAAIAGDGIPLLESAHTWAQQGQRATYVLGVCAVFALGGWILLAWKRPESRRFLMLGVAAIIGHTIAIPIAPFFYLPQRYVAYPVPIIAVIMIATGAAGYLTLFASSQRALRLRPFVIGLAALPLLCCFGGHGSHGRGLTTDLHKSQALFAELARLPKDAMIAGWPRGAVDSIPYASRRQVLVSYETHQAFHADYALEMRRRTEAVIAAYFATSPGPLITLHRKFGVTHLLVDRQHFGDTPPGYFKPFGATIKRAITNAAGEDYEVVRQLKHAQVLRRKRTYLIDLVALSSRAKAH